MHPSILAPIHADMRRPISLIDPDMRPCMHAPIHRPIHPCIRAFNAHIHAHVRPSIKPAIYSSKRPYIEAVIQQNHQPAHWRNHAHPCMLTTIHQSSHALSFRCIRAPTRSPIRPTMPLSAHPCISASVRRCILASMHPPTHPSTESSPIYPIMDASAHATLHHASCV